MATLCACDAGLSNTGRPNCFPIGGVTYSLIIVPTYDDAGTRNSIDTTATLDQAWLTAKLNNTDASQRWFPLPAMKNVEDVRAESLTESFNDGSVIKTAVGTRTFKGLMIKQSPAFFGKIENYSCSDISAFIIDVDGNIIGNGSTADILYPIKLDNETWDPIFMKATDTTVPKIELNYSYSKTENDSDLRMIDSSETTPDMRDIDGLQDVDSVVSNEATTGFTITLTGSYGTQVTANAIKGLVLADFDCNETSPTPAPESLASVTESSDGVYDIVYTTPVASADVLGLDLVKDGFEMTTAVITTP